MHEVGAGFDRDRGFVFDKRNLGHHKNSTMEFGQNESILVLGGSRGLGAALLEQLKLQVKDVKSISRKSELKADFSKSENWTSLVNQIREMNSHRIIYCAAGGPYGSFAKFDWKDHQWALKVTFEFPAFLLHSLLREKNSNLSQVIMVGSSVAESAADPGAAAYCSAKHALRGLITSLQTESLPFDLRLWSPGYMETDLLPQNSSPRLKGLAQNPQNVAQLMIQSISDPALRMKNQAIN